MKRSLRWRKLSSLLIGCSLLALSVWLFVERDFITDSLRAYQFTPSSEVAAMPADTGMSQRGRLLFLASQPVLAEASDFNRFCRNTEENSMVIGCYSQRNIYLYAITNPEVSGIKEVTAAHEMLHAAYERLSTAEQQHVGQMLLRQAELLNQTSQFRERMEAYQSLSPSDQLDEYHSIFGTEVRDLLPDLESYYGQYFNSRQKTVALYEKYTDVFADLKKRTDKLADSLDRLAQQINQRSDSYRAESGQLAIDISRFNNRASGGDFSSQQEFNIERAALVARSNQLDSEYHQIRQMIKDYNAMKARYDADALHMNELTNSLDSNVTPAPEV